MARVDVNRWTSEEGLLLIRGWARDGLTDEDIAHNIGIGRSTLHRWRKLYPVIEEVLQDGKEVADRRVENALFKRATGYKYNEITYNEKGEEVKRVTKDVAPDTTAQIFWLKNRKPDIWRDRKEAAIDTTITGSKLDEIIKQVGGVGLSEEE